ncbi:hypothetical protein [Halorarum salinum]|uniref:Uncharacterized protein n=1 Tax=Halorarum salinum TaxID=2743089 RepID=A0A7D5LAL2_9EURY|nr:hypothetical protein [Halobaculum salinum]QLG61930.1 hypothetical protein HUG12_09435 [Halobaculum salinum]
MGSNSSRAFATRLPDDEATLIVDALDETDQQATDLLRRAVEYYVQENPDRIEAFHPDGSLEEFWAELL